MDGTVFAFDRGDLPGHRRAVRTGAALHVSKTDVNEVLKEGGRGGSGGLRVRRWTRTLIITEVALTLVLLAGAGFMMRSFLTMYQMDPGLETSRLLTMQIYLPLTKYPEVGPRTELFRQFEERLRGISGHRGQRDGDRGATWRRGTARARHRWASNTGWGGTARRHNSERR